MIDKFPNYAWCGGKLIRIIDSDENMDGDVFYITESGSTILDPEFIDQDDLKFIEEHA